MRWLANRWRNAQAAVYHRRPGPEPLLAGPELRFDTLALGSGIGVLPLPAARKAKKQSTR